jgi:hypothetical protein
MFTPENQQIGAGGFGSTNMQEIQELNKALQVDYQMPPTSGANALRAYSIDGTLRTVSYTQKHIKFWNRTPKVKAYSTVEEYVKITNYGNQRAGAFIDAGALPPSQDSNYDRSSKNVKYVGTTRAVQHQAMVVETVVVDDLVAQEQVNGTIYLLGIIEKSLFDGDSSVISQEWDGICTEINKEFNANPTSGIVIDLQGQDITKEILTEASNIILNNYGIPTVMYNDLQTMGKLNSLFYQNQMVTQVDGTGIVGGVVQSNFAYLPKQTFEYEPDVFLKPYETPLTTASSDKAPTAPTISLAAASDANSKIPAGTYDYVVSAINKYGESVGSTKATQAVTAGEKVTVTITKQGNAEVAGYCIYRCLTNGTPLLVARIAKTAGTENGQYVDLNQNIPGTGRGILIYEDPTNFMFKQLVPFLKIPLAIVDASIRWMQLLYGTPILATPRKNVIIKNIKLS